MDNNREELISKLNYIEGWAKEILAKSKKMDFILESICEDYSDIFVFNMDTNTTSIRWEAEDLIYNISEIKQDLINK